MSTTSPQRVTRPSNVADRDDIDWDEVEHIVGEEDHDTALCGVDQTDVPWHQGFPPCMACVEVARGGMN